MRKHSDERAAEGRGGAREHVGSPSADRTILEINGPFDRNTAPKIRRDSLKIAQQQGTKGLEINLARARCVDTSCVAVLLEIMNVVRNHGGRLKLTGIDENTAKLISLSKLDGLFEDAISAERK